MNMSDITPIALLKQLEASVRSTAVGLPEQDNVADTWNGIGFSLLGVDFATSISEINGMLEVPSSTRLPSVKSWVKGVANVRGRLLPIYDLAGYFGGSLAGNQKQQRVLVIDRDQIYAGLCVDRVFEMQHFPVDAYVNEIPPGVPDAVMPFVQGSFKVGNKVWVVLHPLRLLEDDEFLNVAVS